MDCYSESGERLATFLKKKIGNRIGNFCVDIKQEKMISNSIKELKIIKLGNIFSLFKNNKTGAADHMLR